MPGQSLFVAEACSGLRSLTALLSLGVLLGALFLRAWPLRLLLISLTIPNAAVLLFPAWFQTGKDAPQGIEATGQRLIFALGQFLALIVALAPASAVAVGAFFAVKLLAGVTLALAVATVTAVLVLAVEAAFGVLLLGWLFQRFDISGEPVA